jgi:hypothetical protein
LAWVSSFAQRLKIDIATLRVRVEGRTLTLGGKS